MFRLGYNRLVPKQKRQLPNTVVNTRLLHTFNCYRPYPCKEKIMLLHLEGCLLAKDRFIGGKELLILAYQQ